ncbi:MAG TPA: TonB-dependent receptor [Acidobacteriaceae bacterium]|nr:TonB-dependent receptor [Acidobacteriaceae bacterium]
MGLRRAANAVLLALVSVAGGPRCAAQSDTGGSVAGRVLGPDGRGVRGALIRIENPATGDHTDELSGPSGGFRFQEIAPGGYRLQVYARGLSAWEADNLTVGVGTAARLNAVLAPLSLHRTVLVDARLATGYTDASGMAAADLTDLPNNSQHGSALASLFTASAPGADGGLSLRGLSPLMSTIAVDGTSNTLAFRGRERGSEGNGFATAQSATASVQISGGGFPVAPGRAGSAGLSTVTKSGASRMRGQATFYDRGAIGQTYNAYDKVMQTEPAGTTVTAAGHPVMYLNGQPITYVDVPYHAPDRRQTWEVSAGGPIRRGRAFWFFAWEQHDRNDPAVARASEPEVFFFPPSAPTLTALEARLQNSTSPVATKCAATGVPNGGSTAMAACAYSTVLNQLSGLLGTVPRSTRQTIVFPKITWRVNDRNQLTVQYNSMRRTAPHGALSGASEMDGIASFGNSSTSDDAAVARWDFSPAPNLLSSARYQFSRDVLAQTPATPTAFEQQFAQNAWGLPAEVSVDRSEGFSFGTLASVNKREYPAETRQQFTDAFAWIRGRQAVRFGYDYNHVRDAIEGMNGENGAYSYASLLDFISDMLAPDSCDGTTTASGPYPCYTRYRQTLGYPNWWFTTADYAAFVADEWKPGRGLTLTLGLRWDYERVPDTNSTLVNPGIPETAKLPHNRNDFGPRAALSWDIFGRGRTVLRGGFAIDYGRIPNATVFSALTSTGVPRAPRGYSWRPTDVGAPPFPYVFSSSDSPYVDPTAPDQASTAPEVVYFDARFRHPQIDQADLELEQSLGRRTAIVVTGMATNGHDLTQFLDTNIDLANTATVFYAVKAPGNEGNAGPLGKAGTASQSSAFTIYTPQRFYYQRLNSEYGSITDIISETGSSYRGAMVRIVRRLSPSLMVNAGYTWAHAIDDGQNEATYADRNDVYDPADLRLEHGTSNYDVRERVAGAVVVREPWRPRGAAGAFLGSYSLSAAGEWRTGLPYSMGTLGPAPTPSCSYQDWLNAGGATGDGANCLKVVQQPNAVLEYPGTAVRIPSLGPSLNGSGGEDLIPPIGRNTFRYPGEANLDLRLTKRIRLSDRYECELLGEAFNALNHQNVTDIQTIGYRLGNDTAHANMGTLTWQSGEQPVTTTALVNGTSITQYAYDASAAFGSPTSAASSMLQRERQIQAGVKLNF